MRIRVASHGDGEYTCVPFLSAIFYDDPCDGGRDACILHFQGGHALWVGTEGCDPRQIHSLILDVNVHQWVEQCVTDGLIAAWGVCASLGAPLAAPPASHTSLRLMRDSGLHDEADLRRQFHGTLTTCKAFVSPSEVESEVTSSLAPDRSGRTAPLDAAATNEESSRTPRCRDGDVDLEPLSLLL
ncbi:hypothetical protein E2C01_059727 [Portunus trituberculatus]|uniref:Uncharacterized protein n=1 Tax=Portunus trituberculatus TaxID=210409 RepID=A0A5B7H704_PORTR|nr:hypothetical protein [Portunus trituberculatus]